MSAQPHTPLNNRQRQIVDRVREQGFAAVEVLAQDHAVTTQTIRRDIKTLCEAGLLRRYHGGARLPSSVENVAYTARQVMHLAEKQRIAAAVAEQVPDQASLFITLGTSTEEVAKALLHHQGLRVITNNLNVATVLSDNHSSEVIVAGGVVRRRDRGVTGEPTLDFINQFKTDYAVIGISGIEADGTLLDFDYQEVRVQQAIIANTRHVFLAADHSKFGRNALVRLGNISQVHTLFTDAEPPSSIRRIMREAGSRVIVADQKQITGQRALARP